MINFIERKTSQWSALNRQFTVHRESIIAANKQTIVLTNDRRVLTTDHPNANWKFLKYEKELKTLKSIEITQVNLPNKCC